MHHFDTVLVANRGEIARRVIRTLRSMGLRSVAVYSDADVDAPHVREADTAMRIGPASAAHSYLDIAAVIGAARRSGAQAIHPGYGFLSENVAFARACTDAGIVFIGPGEHALDVMGDKIRAKDHVHAHGVPTVPGFSAVGMTDAEIGTAADGIGYPLLVKPSAGGGGKGMQVVTGREELDDALATARRVARASFGDDTLLLERLIERPRHIEVQVLADDHGHVIHLGERECTLQRRHQKVIEESPSPAVDAAIRARLGAAACAAAASVAYRGAGTVEFLVAADDPERFYFIEMNTRLQVEHPVTEAVTGIDLVEQQLRIADGAPLGISQEDVTISGHAIEARVYAEDPTRGFLPSIGDVLRWREAAGARTDAAVADGSVVSADYDPMIAKVIAHDSDRAQALARLDAALADTVVLGLDTNISFLRTLLAQPGVVDGTMDTGLIDRMPPFVAPAPSADALRAAASARADAVSPRRAAAAGPLWRTATRWRSGAPASPPAVAIESPDGSITRVEMSAPAGPTTVAIDTDGWVWVHDDGQTHRLRPLTRREDMLRRLAARARPDAATDPVLRSPMPGAVVAVHVDEGARVSAGDRIMTIEAMKMEHPVTAAHAGVVRLDVAVGEQVRRDQALAHVAADPAAADPTSGVGAHEASAPVSPTP